MKRLRRFNEAERRHVAHCQYCQSKLLKNAVRTFNESEKKQGSQIRADEDAVFAAPLPEKSRFSASERMRACSACMREEDDSEAKYCSACGGKLMDVEDEDDVERRTDEEERDVRRGARAGESVKSIVRTFKRRMREAQRKN